LSRSFLSIQGDTWVGLSKAYYGHEQNESLIRANNPGVPEQIPAGTLLTIPDDPDSPSPPVAQPADSGKDAVTVKIDGEEFTAFTTLVVEKRLDSFDTVTMIAPWDSSDRNLRRIFKPLKYKPLEVFVGPDLYFLGTMAKVVPVDEIPSTLTLSGYAKPGVLDQCVIPTTRWPMEWFDLNLEEIVKAIVPDFGIKVVFEESAGDVFDEVAASQGQKILNFLTGLAQQRGFIIGNNLAGDIVFRKPTLTESPAVTLRQGDPVIMRILPRIKDEEFFSSITAVEEASLTSEGSSFTKQNPLLKGVFRPTIIVPPDAKPGELPGHADAAYARMLANVVDYQVDLATIRLDDGTILNPGDGVAIEAPDAMIYQTTDFMVDSTTLTMVEKQSTFSMGVVLPGSYAGDPPARLPWEE
jgi:prophage tail gpP-like protein